jgi:hypothetical protein
MPAMKAVRDPPNASWGRWQWEAWWARPAIANLSRVPFPLQTKKPRPLTADPISRTNSDFG